MRVQVNHPTTTSVVVTVAGEADDLQPIKQHVLSSLAGQVNIPGFRKGKAPAEVVEKHVDQTAFQNQFLEHAIEDLYPKAMRSEGVRPVTQPELKITKFVPFTTLEFEASAAVLGEVKLPNYKSMKMERPIVKVTDKDVADVIENLRQRSAEKQEVDRAAKKGDEILIDFKGTDKNGKPVKGADGTDYPLVLGSNTFIPGFEDNLLSAKPGETKTFGVTFPKDYAVKALAKAKVTFEVTVKKVQEVKLPEVTDEFAASVGPVKSVRDLKADIKKELQIEKQRQSDVEYESSLVAAITKKAKVDMPPELIDEHTQRLFDELKQNLTYRGQTIKEFLEERDVSEDDYHTNELRPQAEERVKASIVLAEIADNEGIQVTPEELEIRVQVLKGQYKDPQMQAELNKPENRQEIASRMMSEKTVAHLASFANKKT
jgi:trigger factor